MQERNNWLEFDGLYWESDTHEWFHDRSNTEYAKRSDLNNISLPNIKAFVVRNKATGEYDRVLMDSSINQIIFDSKSLEDIGVEIDKLKLLKQFSEVKK